MSRGQSMNISVVIYQEPEGGFSVEVPALPGCFTEGGTLEEALANVREAITGHLEAAAVQASRSLPKKPGETVRVMDIAV